MFSIAVLCMPAPEAASAQTELIGAPVYAADGIEVGRVADVSTTGSRIDALRVSRVSRSASASASWSYPNPRS